MAINKWRAVVPERNEKEEDATEKQLEFIEQLFSAIDSDSIDFKDGALGKWQASHLIDQLIVIKDNNAVDKYDEKLEVHEEREMSLVLGLGIFMLPYIFAWFVLRKGYKKTTKAIVFIWLLLIVYTLFNNH